MHLSCCRYLALDSVVGAATAEAYGDTSAQQKKPSTQTEVTAGSVSQQCSGHHTLLSHVAVETALPCTALPPEHATAAAAAATTQVCGLRIQTDDTSDPVPFAGGGPAQPGGSHGAGQRSGEL